MKDDFSFKKGLKLICVSLVIFLGLFYAYNTIEGKVLAEAQRIIEQEPINSPVKLELQQKFLISIQQIEEELASLKKTVEGSSGIVLKQMEAEINGNLYTSYASILGVSKIIEKPRFMTHKQEVLIFFLFISLLFLAGSVLGTTWQGIKFLFKKK